jgi:hypothetical protein
MFCTGAILTHSPQVIIKPVTGPLPAQDEPWQDPPSAPAVALDHPPRLS